MRRIFPKGPFSGDRKRLRQTPRPTPRLVRPDSFGNAKKCLNGRSTDLWSMLSPPPSTFPDDILACDPPNSGLGEVKALSLSLFLGRLANRIRHLPIGGLIPPPPALDLLVGKMIETPYREVCPVWPRYHLKRCNVYPFLLVTVMSSEPFRIWVSLFPPTFVAVGNEARPLHYVLG